MAGNICGETFTLCHVVRVRVTCLCHVLRKNFDRAEIAFTFGLSHWLKPFKDEKEKHRSTWYLDKTTNNSLIRKCHILKVDNSRPTRGCNTHWNTGGRRLLGKQTCLGPKYTCKPGINARGSLNQALKQYLETELYKPLCHCGFKVLCARTYPHSYGMLHNAHVQCIRWSIAIGPLSTTVVPLHLTQMAVPFVQITTTVCFQGM